MVTLPKKLTGEISRAILQALQSAVDIMLLGKYWCCLVVNRGVIEYYGSFTLIAVTYMYKVRSK